MDALDRVAGRRFGKEAKREYAIMKSESEYLKDRGNSRAVMDASQKFREEINRQRKQAGLL